MNIARLVELLLQVEDQTLEVKTDGCDCWGDAKSICVFELDSTMKILLIRRDEEGTI